MLFQNYCNYKEEEFDRLCCPTTLCPGLVRASSYFMSSEQKQQSNCLFRTCVENTESLLALWVKGG